MPDLRLQQKQKLLLSAQQILSSQLLQLPMLNLEQRIYEELQENPLLEVVEERKDTAGDVTDDGDREESDDMFDSVERFSKSSLKDRNEAPPPGESTEGRLSFTYESGPKERGFFKLFSMTAFMKYFSNSWPCRKGLAGVR